MSDELEIGLISEKEKSARIEIEKSIYDLDDQIKLLSSQADKIDYLVAIASGVLCGMIDILWVGDFYLAQGRDIADSKIGDFVKQTAKMMGCKEDDLTSTIAFLEKIFPIPADGNTPDFGGGLQHHLRDFAHHPTIVGLLFSILTQFTEKSYGTDTLGNFIIVPVPEKSKIFIGESVPDKIFRGTVIWFFHLVSDMAGSSGTAVFSGGTGIPGPVLSLAKELSVLPVFKNLEVGDNSLSVFLSKVFNGTIFNQYDKNGKIIKDLVVKFDLRGELGGVLELGRQAVPVLANECIVRSFYFLRRLISELQNAKPRTFNDIKMLDWNKIKPVNNPTLTRMLTIATGIFTTIDITEAIVTKKYWISVNYVGIGRFTIAIGEEMINFLKVRDVKKIKEMYETINRNTFKDSENRIYERM
ncbi:MAG: hypothetical protein GX640_09650, partial [Fibrobacter sp.]|nr:hypothetical protein [Fibrobacter sp.]